MFKKIILITIILLEIVMIVPQASMETPKTNPLRNISYLFANFSARMRMDMKKKLSVDSDCSCNNNYKMNNFRAEWFRKFWTYRQIEQYLNMIADEHPERAQLKALGKTHENRTIYAMKIGVEVDGNNIVFVTAGMYAKEWNAIMMALYIIHVLVECNLYDEIGLIEWIIIPVINPDGYVYSFTNFKHRMWIKNRKPCLHNEGSTCQIGQGCGVNIDKNFQFMFPASIGSSRNPCSDFYPGTEDGSEAESRITMDMLSSVRHRIKLYIGIRTYGSLIVYPYAAGMEVFVDNPEEMTYVAKLAADAINKRSHRHSKYTYGSYASTIVPETGTSLDYSKGTLQVQYAYYIHLRGLHQPPKSQILPIIKECFYGVCAMVKHISDKYPPPKKFLRKLKGLRRRRGRRNASQRDTFSYLMFAIVICMYYYVGS